MRRHIRRPLPREIPQSYRAWGNFVRLRLRTSAQEVVFAFPESRSAIRLPISASQAACTPSSTSPSRFEIRESANASCSSMDNDKACSSNFETFGVICAMPTSLGPFYRAHPPALTNSVVAQFDCHPERSLRPNNRAFGSPPYRTAPLTNFLDFTRPHRRS